MSTTCTLLPRTRLSPPMLAGLLLLACFASEPASALCGGPLSRNNFERPIDFNDPTERKNIKNVVDNHFNRDVESLRKGMHSPLPGDIYYTLFHIPNHYRALDAMARWQRKMQKEGVVPPERSYSAECFFERAFAFKPEDPVLYLIYGIHQHRSGDLNGALETYQHAETLNSNYSELSYNRALLHLDRNEVDEAKKYARLAYGANYPLPGLRFKLEQIGAWPP